MSPKVAWVMGSDSDLQHLTGGIDLCGELGLDVEVRVFSAHRTPRELTAWLDESVAGGVSVFVAAAGWAAALPGVVAAHVPVPVLGVPIPSSTLQGLDALLSIAQMPGGVPVGTMSLGSAGAKNAAVMAASILALGDPAVREKLAAFREQQRAKVLARDAAVQKDRGA